MRSFYYFFFAACIFFTAVSANAGEPIEIEIENCIRLEHRGQKIFRNEAEMFAAVRNDASRTRCIETMLALQIDFSKYRMAGVSISSGYCRKPLGLAARLSFDHTLLKAIVDVTYTDPGGNLCKALSQYDLWLLVPVPHDGYTFEVSVETEKADLRPKCR